MHDQLNQVASVTHSHFTWHHLTAALQWSHYYFSMICPSSLLLWHQWWHYYWVDGEKWSPAIPNLLPIFVAIRWKKISACEIVIIFNIYFKIHSTKYLISKVNVYIYLYLLQLLILYIPNSCWCFPIQVLLPKTIVIILLIWNLKNYKVVKWLVELHVENKRFVILMARIDGE